MKNIIRTLVFFIELSLLVFPTNTLADEEEYEITCEMTIDGKILGGNNQAYIIEPINI
ncbi:hypothetical protein J2R98_001653 [Alkalibacillus filiformis]|uniref:Uncharacterized protein n=1 Tax=Alkalibacillus filiformis TaxID=200990 RepID=A0ABU0DU54_9BACI|nr:hypothetical protein [Alkalibacillus filiformis]MDQ0351821.1 hypothetical protein [Alkalibacillus filiformis]